MKFWILRLVPKTIFVILMFLIFGGMAGRCGKDFSGTSITEETAGDSLVTPPTAVEPEGEQGPECGNAILESGEECDDGNFVTDDGCDTECKREPIPVACGNGVVEEGEACDDGNSNNYDHCKNNCAKNVCGDKIKNDGVEECDSPINCDNNCNGCYGYLFVSNRGVYSNVYYSCTSDGYPVKKITDNTDLTIFYNNPTTSSDALKMAFQRLNISSKEESIIYGDTLRPLYYPDAIPEYPLGFEQLIYLDAFDEEYPTRFPEFSTPSGETIMYLVGVKNDWKKYYAMYSYNPEESYKTIYKPIPEGWTFLDYTFIPEHKPSYRKFIASIRDYGNTLDESEDDTANLYYFDLDHDPPLIKPVYRHPGVNFSQVALSPKKDKLAFTVHNPATHQKHIYVCDFHSNTDLESFGCQDGPMLLAEQGKNQSPCWSPDGKKILFERKEEGGFHWNLYMLDAGEVEGSQNVAVELHSNDPNSYNRYPHCLPQPPFNLPRVHP